MRVNRWSPQLLIIIILPLALFWRWLILGEVLYWGTLLFQFWPWHQLVKINLLAGEWPLWNPLLGNGTPLLANLQSAVFYPPNLLYLLMPVEQGLTLSIILHLMLAGLFMYLYTRQLQLSPFAALLSALTFMFSGYLIGRTQFVPMINTAVWLPLSLLLCENLIGTRLLKGRGGLVVIGLGLALALAILAGHAQLWFYTVCLLAAYTLFRSWQKARVDVEQSPVLAVLQAGWRLGLSMIVALLLAAAQLLPTAEFVLQSDRGGGAERTFALTYSFWPWRLITLLAPNFFGHPASGDYWGYANFWEDHAYMGILPLLLVLVAVWHYLRRSILKRSGQPQTTGAQTRSPDLGHPYRQVIPFYALLIPVSLILAMGWNTPVYLWIFETIPGFAYFQAPARLLIWYTVAVAILAGSGAQLFEQTPIHRPTWRRLLVASIGLGMAALAGGLLLSDRSRTFLMATFSLGVWLVLSIIMLLSRPDQQEGPSAGWRIAAWRWTMIAVVTVDLLLAAVPLIPTLPPTIFTKPIASAEFLKKQPNNSRFYVAEETDYAAKYDQFFRFETFGPPDVSYWQTFRETLVPNLGIYAGLPSTNNDDPLRVGRWKQFTKLLGRSDPALRFRLLSLANVGFLLDNTGDKVGPAIYEAGGVPILQVADPRSRAYFVTKAYRANDETEAIARLTGSDFDSRQEVVIIGNQADAVPVSTPTAEPIDQLSSAPSTSETSPMSVTEQSPHNVTLTVHAAQPGFVVLTDTYYPGWQATVDGQLVQIWPANLAFRAVAIDAGPHTIQYSYRPSTFRWGVWISGITLLVVLTVGGLLIRSRNQGK